MKKLPRSIVVAIDRSMFLGIRADAHPNHRFTGVWPIVLDGRVFARSWRQKPDGWYRALREDSRCTIQIGDRRVRARAVATRSKRLRDAIEKAYAEKYPTPSSRKYVRGFRATRRRETTTEFVPR